ncbi:MAG: alanine racemase [Firmicutes bacterium]|nr:alanine racemase [Bacillota bacterium]
MIRKTELLRPAWAEIDTAALIENFRRIRRHAGPGATFAAVVKADGYGHGMLEVSRLLVREGAERLAVATIPEGMKLREIGIGVPILVLGLSPAETFPFALEADLTLPISSLAQARALADAARLIAAKKTAKGDATPAPVPFFLVLDTGMGRIGLHAGADFGTAAETELTEAAFREACAILSLEGLKCEGIFSHLADADDRTEKGVAYTKRQLSAFRRFTDRLAAEGFDPGILSIANSGAILDYPETTDGLCRPGIILYGYHPAGKGAESPFPLIPVMSVRARLTLVKTVPAGTAIGYGSTFVTDRETVIGTVPVGYADGYPRLLSNRGAVLIRGRKAPIVGNVCMDQFMVDLSGIPDAAEGDTVTLLGTDGGLSITADDIASEAETISWEILCGLGQRLERIYR